MYIKTGTLAITEQFWNNFPLKPYIKPDQLKLFFNPPVSHFE